METIMYVLPLLFALLGWAAGYFEFFAFAGALGFWTSFTIVSEANPLTNSEVMLAVIYLVFSVGILIRIIVQSEKEEWK